jgi:hypothetical protein
MKVIPKNSRRLAEVEEIKGLKERITELEAQIATYQEGSPVKIIRNSRSTRPEKRDVEPPLKKAGPMKVKPKKAVKAAPRPKFSPTRKIGIHGQGGGQGGIERAEPPPIWTGAGHGVGD